jgi:chemosensory pili system protein ChpB (putative protein-glutamate methylesterase)
MSCWRKRCTEVSGLLQIGVLADSAGKVSYLTASVTRAGHRVLVSSQLNNIPQAEVDAWLVDVALEQDETNSQLVEQFLESSTVPVIVCDSSEHRAGSDEHSAWLRRTVDKLQRLGGEFNLQQVSRARNLWVLAASTGGPAAVKAFLSQVPAGLDLAFIYVQHIDEGYTPTLIKMMAEAGAFRVELARQGAVVEPGVMIVVSARTSVELLENGTLMPSDRPWGGCYAPSVDELAANVARVYRQAAGMIVFSGMGDDGAAASRLIRQQGGQVWAQTPASCVSSSMPDAALAAGCVDFTGTPEELADALAERWSTPLIVEEEHAK